MPLPISPINEITHLKADLRGRRLALLVMAYSPDIISPLLPGRLVMVELSNQLGVPGIHSGAKDQGGMK